MGCEVSVGLSFPAERGNEVSFEGSFQGETGGALIYFKTCFKAYFKLHALFYAVLTAKVFQAHVIGGVPNPPDNIVLSIATAIAIIISIIIHAALAAQPCDANIRVI